MALPSWPQLNTNQATLGPMLPVVAKRGTQIHVKVPVRLLPGYHINSNKPLDEDLIPLRLTWSPGTLEAGRIDYPPGKMEKYEFSEKPLSVLTGDVEIGTEFKVPASASVGAQTVMGKLRYQACDNRACYPPRNIDIKLQVDVQ